MCIRDSSYYGISQLFHTMLPKHIHVAVKACTFTVFLNTVGQLCFITGSMRAAQACRYLIYSEADFEVSRPEGASRCTDGGEIWLGGGDRSSLLCAKFHPHRCNDKGVGPQKLKFLLRFDRNV